MRRSDETGPPLATVLIRFAEGMLESDADGEVSSEVSNSDAEQPGSRR